MKNFFVIKTNEPLKEIFPLLLSILLFATAIGIDLVTFPTILNQHHISASKIGFAFTCEVFGTIIISFFITKIIAKFGVMNALRFSSFGYAGAILIIYFYRGFYLWISLAFLMGSCWLIYVITRQSWLNAIVSNKNRGIVLGFFSMTISAGLAIGPVIASISGVDNYRSFIISALIVIASYLSLLPLRHKAPKKIDTKRISLKKFFIKNPRCFLGRFFLDFQTYFLLTFTVIYGRMIGLSYERAGLLISVFMASGFCDIIVGFLLRKFDPYRLMLIGFLIYMCCFIFIIFYHESYALLLATYFIFGIGVACIYVSVFKIANDDYSKNELVAANSTFQIVGSLGSLFGAAIGGFFVEIFGAQGFPVLMILSCVLYLTILIIYEKKLTKN